jgi:predicted deacylase
VYHQALGAQVSEGEIIAELIDVHRINHRTPIRSRTEGLLFTQARDPLVRPGQSLAKIAGAHPLDYRQPGKLLQD